LREQYPAQWAAEKIAMLIQKLEDLDMESTPEVKIVVNGLPFTIRPPEHMISYEQIALMAGKPEDNSLTITYEIFPPWRAKRSGTLRPGRSVDVEDGMIFNAIDTGLA
jgi:hypothetical protein